MPLLLKLVRLLGARLRNLRWALFAVLLLIHGWSSWWLMVWAGEAHLTSFANWVYYYMVTATTIGYGDLSPQSPTGRLIATVWLLPGAVALFASFLGKVSAGLYDFWRRGLMGKLEYAQMRGHTILVGWHGEATERMVDLLLADVTTDDEGIVLCVTQAMENPLPERVKFVRGDSFHSGTLLRRAGVAGAARVLIYGANDDENLAIALSVLQSVSTAHVVVHFEDIEVARILQRQYPRAECTSTLAVEMLVRAAQDPGISVVTNELLSVDVGPAQFALALPASFPATDFGKLYLGLKQRHNATAIGLADDRQGQGLRLNPPLDAPVRGGQVLYYLANQRIPVEAVSSCV